jgi:hypothetical protein
MHRLSGRLVDRQVLIGLLPKFAGLALTGAIRLTFGASLSLFCRMILSKKSATFVQIML